MFLFSLGVQANKYQEIQQTLKLKKKKYCKFTGAINYVVVL